MPYGQDGSCSFSGITNRLDKIREGDVFIVLNPDPTAARRQIVAARLQGAAAVVSAVEPYIKNISCILVDDPAAAMKTAAKYHRSRLSGTVIGVTGSCGKTTTKELLYSVLSRTAQTARSPGTSNALSATAENVLSVGETDRYAVIEAGIAHLGEMEQISAILQPDIGIVTNIGAAHLEGLGTVENVLAEKLKIFEHSPPGFTAFLNGDDPLLQTVTDIRGVKPRFFHASDWRGELPFAGEHFRADVAAAAAVARFLGVSETEIEAAVADFVLTEGRCSRLRIGNINVIEDDYNANPLSVRAALDLLSGCESRRVAVLGDMLELGEKGIELHGEIGRYAAEKNVEELVCIGELAENIYRSAVDAGFPQERSAWYPDMETFLSAADWHFHGGDTVLLKASRAMHFERIRKQMETEQEKRLSPAANRCCGKTS